MQRAIIELLGEEAFVKKGIGYIYNTEYVAKRVFAEPELLEALNNIVHPAVKEDILSLPFRRRVSSGQSNRAGQGVGPVLFVESAILFEAGLDKLCDKIIVVEAPEEVRIARTIARDYKGAARPENINKVRARIRAQKSPTGNATQGKIYTVLNDGSLVLSRIVDRICDIATD